MQKFKDHSKVISGDSIFFNERKAAVLAFFLSFARPSGRPANQSRLLRERKNEEEEEEEVSSQQFSNKEFTGAADRAELNSVDVLSSNKRVNQAALLLLILPQPAIHTRTYLPTQLASLACGQNLPQERRKKRRTYSRRAREVKRAVSLCTYEIRKSQRPNGKCRSRQTKGFKVSQFVMDVSSAVSPFEK